MQRSLLRVMHLPTGDYILIGPERFEDIRGSRTRDNELWFLSRQRGSKPVRLGQKMSEGAAVSKRSPRIAFTQVHPQNPELAETASQLVIADIDLSGSQPKLLNKTVVHESKDRNCVLEALGLRQDLDLRITAACEDSHRRVFL